MPDLQKVVDSGADTLCVRIVLPYYNSASWMEIPGWEEYKKTFLNSAIHQTEQQIEFHKNAECIENPNLNTGPCLSEEYYRQVVDMLESLSDAGKLDWYLNEFLKSDHYNHPKVKYANQVMQQNFDNLLSFLENNNAKFEPGKKSSLAAAIPTTLLDELIVRDDVGKC